MCPTKLIRGENIFEIFNLKKLESSKSTNGSINGNPRSSAQRAKQNPSYRNYGSAFSEFRGR
jgi:hypothetical protein